MRVYRPITRDGAEKAFSQGIEVLAADRELTRTLNRRCSLEYQRFSEFADGMRHFYSVEEIAV